MKRERRVQAGVHLRASNENQLTGHAALFNVRTNIDWFEEIVKPGAFRRAIKEKQDVRCLLNHDSNLILGRTRNGTLQLQEDEKGLKFSCDLPATQLARDLRVSIGRRDIDQCSFSFVVREQTWTEEKNRDGLTIHIRSIEDVDLLDVSPVTFPSYEQTSCSVRSLWPDGVPRELSNRRVWNRQRSGALSAEEVLAGAKARARRADELQEADLIDWAAAVQRTLAVSEFNDADVVIDACVQACHELTKAKQRYRNATASQRYHQSHGGPDATAI